MLTDYGDNMHCQFFEILRSLLDSSPGAQVCFLSSCLLHISLTSHRFSSATVLTIRNLLFYSIIVERSEKRQAFCDHIIKLSKLWLNLYIPQRLYLLMHFKPKFLFVCPEFFLHYSS